MSLALIFSLKIHLYVPWDIVLINTDFPPKKVVCSVVGMVGITMTMIIMQPELFFIFPCNVKELSLFTLYSGYLIGMVLPCFCV